MTDNLLEFLPTLLFTPNKDLSASVDSIGLLFDFEGEGGIFADLVDLAEDAPLGRGDADPLFFLLLSFRDAFLR